MQNPFNGGNGMIPLPNNFATVHNKQKRQIKIGKVGFSITALLFSCLPAVFRRDWYNLACMVAIELIVSMLISIGFKIPIVNALYDVGQLSGFVWGFFYNMMYFRHLQKIGFVPSDQHSKELLANSRYMKF